MGNGKRLRTLVRKKLSLTGKSFSSLCQQSGLSESSVNHWFLDRSSPSSMNLILLIESLSMESNEHPDVILKQVMNCFNEYRFAVERYEKRNNVNRLMNIDREQWKQLKTIIDQITVSS